MRRSTVYLFLIPAITAIAGCSDAKQNYADVRGKVTLNGKPIPGASVEFQPLPSDKGADPGSGSMAITDSEGRFSLKSQLDDRSGAIVGKHQVRIFLYTANVAGKELDADSGPAKKKPAAVLIPIRYGSESELVVEVPASGLSDYHFDLKSP